MLDELHKLLFTGQVIPIFLNIVAAVLGAFGQFSYKRGSARIAEIAIWKNYDIWLGASLFCIVMVLFVVAYRLGGKMSVVYPFYSTTFIWAAIIATNLVGETMNLMQWLGVVCVVLGSALIAAFQKAT